MTNEPDAALLPCPFCGGEAKEGEYWRSWDTRDHQVWCYGECGASVTRKTKAEAIAAWNRRAGQAHERAERDALVAALQEAIDWDSYDEEGEPAVWLTQARAALASTKGTGNEG